MIHCNNNLIAAINISTSGPNPRFHDLIEICVLILDEELKPSQTIFPFYTYVQPRRPQNIDLDHMTITKAQLMKLLQSAMDADRVADLFDEWYNRLKLPFRKKIMPLSYYWPLNYAFLEDLFGPEHMQHYFSTNYRDLLPVALLENDKADHQVEQTPFPKVNLQYICSCLKIPRQRPHDTLKDCLVIAEAYRKILKSGASVLKVSTEPDGDLDGSLGDEPG